jgi:hypothetical protein
MIEKFVISAFIAELKEIFGLSDSFKYPDRLKLIAEQFPETKRTLPALIVSLSGPDIRSDYLADLVDTQLDVNDNPFEIWGFVAKGTLNIDCITQDSVSCRELTSKVLDCFVTQNSGLVYYGSEEEIITALEDLDEKGIWCISKSVQGERQEAITESEYLWINTVKVEYEYEILLKKLESGIFELYSITPIIY